MKWNQAGRSHPNISWWSGSRQDERQDQQDILGDDEGLDKGFVWFVNTKNEIGKFKPIREWPAITTSTTSVCVDNILTNIYLPFSSAEMQVKNVPLYDRHTHSTLYSERWTVPLQLSEILKSTEKMDMKKIIKENMNRTDCCHYVWKSVKVRKKSFQFLWCLCWCKYKNIQKYLYFNDWFQSPQLPTVHKLKRGNSAEKLFELLSEIQFNRNLKSKYQISKYFIVNPFC